MDSPKYPHIKVKLVGTDGNAFALLGKVKNALMKNNVPQIEIDEFLKTAMSGDYDDLLCTCMNTVDVD
ncbi:MAG: hypothetical protein AABY32_01430 [Nanoarchaeota archaeon]